MASKAITHKQRTIGDNRIKASPHSSVAAAKASSSTATKTPRAYELPRSPQFLKGNLDKENNNSTSSVLSNKSQKASNSPLITSSSCKSLKTAVKSAETVNKTSTTTTTPKAKLPNKSKESSLCAASVLLSSTNTLARRHRLNTPKSKYGQDINKMTGTPQTNYATRPGTSGKKPPTGAEKSTPGNLSPYRSTPPRRKLCVENSAAACASPTLRSVPNDMVRNLVKTIESKPPVLPNSGTNGKRMNEESLPSFRRNLAKHLTLSAKNKSRSSFISNLSHINDKEVIPEDFSVTVAVRVRPFSQKEKDSEAKQVIFMHENETTVTDGNGEHTFSYDFSFNSIEESAGTAYATQAFVYQKLARPLLSAAFNGYNTCLFAYGQTGSGKSYTIMGNSQETGVVPRFCQEMFGGVKAVISKDKTIQFHIEMSYFEIYNEKIHDLLVSCQVAPDGEKKKQSLRVREHPETGPYVEGLATFVVRNFEDIQSWLDVGNRQRVTASTGMNDKSSRSHSVFILNMTRTSVEELEGERHESSRRSRINLVDLAGSERSSTAQTTGQRLKEGGHINKSLLTLGKVISMLSERSKASSRRQSKIFIPYRDSALTWLLKESLGGNSRTAMIATVSPADIHMEETLSTLRYAAQARTIVNSVKINEDPNAAIIRELKSEIAKLRAAQHIPSVKMEEYRTTVAQLREKLSVAENEKEEVNTKWRTKLEESEKRKAEEINELKRAGVSFKVNNRLPNLVNLNEDPQLSELLLYVIKRGTTRVGKKGGPHECEIQLAGALIADIHCEIMNKNEVVTITPSAPDAKIFINGEMIQKMTTLHHADRIVIAGDHFFRLNHPIEVQKKKKIAGSSDEEKKDFEFAKNELINAQNARMEAEIEQARLRAKQEMLKEIELAKQEAQNEITEQKEQYEQVVKSLKHKLEEDEKAMEQLEVIREENLVLQKEVDANRRRQELEAKIGAQKMVVEENDSVTMNVFAELEAERLKLAKDIERMEKNLKKKKESHGAKGQTADCGKWTPLRISILLEEANRISKELETETVFSRHDLDDGQIQVKVENTKLEIWTLWSMEKFEEKVEGMREAYNMHREKNTSENDGSGYSDTESNLFYDPSDTWWEVFNTATIIQTRERCDATTETPTSTRPNKSRRITRRLSSLTLARTSPALQQSLLQYEQRQRSLPMNHGRPEISVKTVCKNVLKSMVEDFEESNESSMDLLLTSLHRLSCTSEDLANIFYSQQNSSPDESSVLQSEEISLKATMELKSCGFCIQLMKSTTMGCKKQKFASKLIQKLTESTKKLSGELAKLLQGCELEIEPIIRESSGKIRVLIPNMAKYAGALCLAMKTPLNALEGEKEHALAHRIKNAFIQGTDSFLRKMVTEALTNVGNSYCMTLDSDHSGELKMFKSALDLLQACRDLQQRLCEASLMLRETDLPPLYYQQYVQRGREMTEVICDLAHKLEEFDTALKIGDQCWDFTETEEKLQECAKQIAMLSLPHEALLEVTSDDKNSNNNNSASIEEGTERMYYAVQDAAEDFIDAVISAFGSKKRNASLDGGSKLIETPVHQPSTIRPSRNVDLSESTAISSSVKKLLELTDNVS